jgi:hypothetical protein
MASIAVYSFGSKFLPPNGAKAQEGKFQPVRIAFAHSATGARPQGSSVTNCSVGATVQKHGFRVLRPGLNEPPPPIRQENRQRQVLISNDCYLRKSLLR